VIVCHLCKGEIGAGDRFQQAVWGWEKRVVTRASGSQGGSDIQNRRRFERFAHTACIDREAAGVNALQETLV